MIRGIERREIFTDNADREDFIERLSDLLPETGTQCHAWSFLRQRDRMGTRDLLCYWCAVDLEIPMADLPRRLNLTLAAVSYGVKRGEEAAKEGGWRLDE
jgi:hypothetical protein